MIPAKPFATYKWRWLSVQPSEGLLKAAVFLGVLRVLAEHEGKPFSAPEIQDALSVVDTEAESAVRLARGTERNLIRNSGQYWRGTGLLAPRRGIIKMTRLGLEVAQGRVTQGEFAALMVQQTVLPNLFIHTAAETAKWRAAGLEIRPLKLILEVIATLGRTYGNASAYLTNHELVRIMIPLAGMKFLAPEIAKQIDLHRRKRLDVSGWPDCAPEDNDMRIAKEFLLFLANFGLLRLDPDGAGHDQRFWLDEVFDVDAAVPPVVASIFSGADNGTAAIEEVLHSPLPSVIERMRVWASVLARPGQAKFRTDVMLAHAKKCLVTGEAMPEVLEAAHVIPVNNGGKDEVSNGLCLRVDIHRLFDSGNLRVSSDGSITFSNALLRSTNYKLLPKQIKIPPFVSRANIKWRHRYL